MLLVKVFYIKNMIVMSLDVPEDTIVHEQDPEKKVRVYSGVGAAW